jgi:two-component system cell cycle response regulator
VSVEWDEDTKVSDGDQIIKLGSKDRDRAYLTVLAGVGVGEMHKLAASETVIGRGPQADIQVVDDGLSRRHAVIEQRGDQMWLRDLGSTNGTFCNGERIREHVLQDGDKIQVGAATILKFNFHDSIEETFQRQIYDSALRDGLTKTFNRKYFLERLESEFAYASRHDSHLSLLMFDIDHFKKINDCHGHLAGDHALVTIAQAVQQTIRKEDVLARFGGEEFAVICRGIDLSGAVAFGERIRRCVDEQSFEYQRARFLATVSVGVAATPDVAICETIDLLRVADDALYRAKRQGRNRVVSGRDRLETPPTDS